MHLWLLFLTGTAVYGISRISEPDLKAVNFAKVIEGRKLNGSVIKEVEVDSEESCSFECLEEEKCQSYNFKTTKSKAEGFKCQLSDSDRFVGVTNFIEDENFSYVGIQTACDTVPSPCGEKEVCIPNYQDGSARCKCVDGYAGKPCKAKSCAQLIQDGLTSDGVYTINPDGGKPIPVFCDMTTDGGGWTVFQKRLNGSVDFRLNWTAYKNGFGDLNSEFWLGNDNLHRLTAADNLTMRVDLEDFEGNITYAEYTSFKVADEGDKYRLFIGGFNGTAGDSMAYHNKMQFSTGDDDNDRWPGSCSERHKGGWWYNHCHQSNLNGLYLRGPHPSVPGGHVWKAFRGFRISQ